MVFATKRLLILILLVSVYLTSSVAMSIEDTKNFASNMKSGKIFSLNPRFESRAKNQDRAPKIRVRGDIEDSGWMDPYYRLASYWAPTIYQYTYSDYVKGDFLTRFDYDGDWIGNNNWDNLDSINPIWAYIYYAVIETETHYYIFYMIYHPKDWSAALPYFDEHENDMEGAMVVISKDGTRYGSLLLVETRAHTDFYQYTNDPNISTGSDDVDGGILLDTHRPRLYVEAQGHGVYCDPNKADDLYSYDGIVIYRFESNTTGYPSTGNNENVSYSLIPIMKSLWPRRYDIGDGKTYDQPFLYQGARYSFNNETPAAFDGDNGYGNDKANPPWGMDDGNDGDVYQGDWFFDPAYTVSTHLTIPYNFSLDYTYNPYLIEGGPDFNPPTITIYSPSSDEYVLVGNVNISWYVDDEFDLYNLTVYVDDQLEYTSKTKGYGEITVGLPDGKHSLNICAIDIWGNYHWIYREFYVDTEPPDLTVLAPTNNSYFNETTVTLNWTSSDENGIAGTDIYVDGNLEASLGPETNSHDVDLTEGSHTIRIVSNDNAGRSNESRLNVIIDLTPPSLTIISPENNTSIIYEDTVIVEWNANDNNEVDYYEVKVDNGSWTNVHKNESIELKDLTLYDHYVYVKAIDLAGNAEIKLVKFTLNPSEPELINADDDSEIAITTASDPALAWNISGDYDHVELIVDNESIIDVGKRNSYIFRGLSEGTHNITIRIVYPAGDYIDKTYKIMIDKSPPQINSKSTIKIDATSNTTTIKWNASDSLSGIEHYEVRIDGEAWIYMGNNTEYMLDASNLQDGYHIFIIRAYDKVGNTAQKILIIIVDRENPQIEIKYPENNTHILSTKVTIAITANDNLGIKNIEILLNNTLYTQCEYIESITITNLSDGYHILKIIAYDIAGNINETKICFYVDTAKPQISIYSPQDTAKIQSTSITVEWTCNEEATYCVRIDDASWIYNGNNTSYTFYGVEQGKHVIYVMAKDKAGNTATDTVVVEVINKNGANLRNIEENIPIDKSIMEISNTQHEEKTIPKMDTTDKENNQTKTDISPLKLNHMNAGLQKEKAKITKININNVAGDKCQIATTMYYFRQKHIFYSECIEVKHSDRKFFVYSIACCYR